MACCQAEVDQAYCTEAEQVELLAIHRHVQLAAGADHVQNVRFGKDDYAHN